MRNIVALALVVFTLPISAWSQLAPAEDTGKDDIRKTGDNDAPLFDPATFTFHGSFRAHSTLTTVDEAVEGRSETEFGLSDAYSRVGARIDFGYGGTKFSIKSELGLNLADLELGDPCLLYTSPSPRD